jgi:glycosyltransferase involved in cell wall biosynthesis
MDLQTLPSHPRAIVAANASLGVGGQGLNLQHMLEGVRARFEVTTYCKGGAGAYDARSVPTMRFNRVFATPVLRRLRDWQAFLSDREFDRYVAAHLEPAALFQGAVGQCSESLARARQLGSRTLLDVVTTHVDHFREQQERECARFGVRVGTHRLSRERIRREYDEADAIRVMSDRARDTMIERGVPLERVFTIRPFFDASAFQPALFAEPVFRVSFVGLIEPWKGFHYLVEAYKRLGLRDSELVLWGGTGTRPVRRYMDEAIRENPSIQIRPVAVSVVGPDKVYGISSVLVHPSLADGFGYVVAEAMLCGIPVIVTDRTGAADLVEDGVSGYIVPAADPGAIADRLEHLSRNPGLVEQMGRAAREAAATLTFERFLAAYDRCFDALGFEFDSRPAAISAHD